MSALCGFTPAAMRPLSAKTLTSWLSGDLHAHAAKSLARTRLTPGKLAPAFLAECPKLVGGDKKSSEKRRLNA